MLSTVSTKIVNKRSESSGSSFYKTNNRFDSGTSDKRISPIDKHHGGHYGSKHNSKHSSHHNHRHTSHHSHKHSNRYSESSDKDVTDLVKTFYNNKEKKISENCFKTPQKAGAQNPIFQGGSYRLESGSGSGHNSGRDINRYDSESTRTINSNSDSRSDVVYEPIDSTIRFLRTGEAFNMMQLLKYVGSTTEPEFLPYISGVDSNRNAIIRYIGRITADKTEFRHSNSPFMRDPDVMIKLNNDLHSFQKNRMISVVTNRNTADRINLFIYNLLNHTLKMLMELGPTFKHDRHKRDDILKYSVGTVFRMTKFIDQRLDNIHKRDAELKNIMTRCAEVRSTAGRKLDRLVRLVDQQNRYLVEVADKIDDYKRMLKDRRQSGGNQSSSPPSSSNSNSNSTSPKSSSPPNKSSSSSKSSSNSGSSSSTSDNQFGGSTHKIQTILDEMSSSDSEFSISNIISI